MGFGELFQDAPELTMAELRPSVPVLDHMRAYLQTEKIAVKLQ